MNKIELKITTSKGLDSVAVFDDIDQVQKWVEEFYQISFIESKTDYEKIRDESDAHKKYPELFKEFTLDVWFEKNGVKLFYRDENSSKRYDNGELVTKPRMQEEEWYYNLYQPFLEFSIYGGCLPDVDKTYEEVLLAFKNIFHEKLSDKDKERILRWSVLHCERHKFKPDFVDKTE